MPTSALPRGKTTTLLLKGESVYGTAPIGNWTQTFAYSHASDFKKPFDDDQLLGLDRHNNRDATEPAPGLVTFDDSIVVPVDFNHIGVWLNALFGDGEVTGEADPYTHVFRSGLEVLPWRSHEWKLSNALFEQDVGLVGSKLDIEMSRAGGFQKATVALMGQTQNKIAASGGGMPEAPWAREPCSAATGVFKVGGALAANIMSVKASYDNKLTPQDYLGNELRSGFDLDNEATHSSGVLTLDPAPSWEPVQTYIQIRTRRGGGFGPVKVSRFGADKFALVNAEDLAAVEVAQGMTLASALARADDAEDPSFVLGTASHTAKDCIVLQGRPNGDRVTLMMAVDDARVHDDALADPPDIPLAPALRDRAAPIIIMLQGNFRQGVAEAVLDASWAPAASTFYYEAHVSYDVGASWSSVYQGEQPNFSALVDYASLQLRVRGVGVKKGAFNVIPIEPPNITVRPDVIEIESFKQGLRDYVARELKEGFERLDKIAQFIASFASEQDAHNWLQKNQTHALLELKSQAASASIDEVRTVALGVDAALASFELTVNATLGDHEASISQNATAISTIDTSFSSFSTTVNAHFGTLDASVTTNATAITTVNNKLAAQWTLTLNVNGYISGMKSFNDGSAAGTIFVGDIFQVAFPGQNGGNPVPVFSIGNVNGSAKVALRGDIFVDGVVTARMIQAAQVQAVHLTANSVVAGKIGAGAIDVGTLIADNVIITGHLQVNSIAVVSVAFPADFTFIEAPQGFPRLVGQLSVFVVPGGGNLLITAGFTITSVPGGAESGNSPATSNAIIPLLTSFIQVNFDGARYRKRVIPPVAVYSNLMTIQGSPTVNFGLNGVAPGFHTIDLYYIQGGSGLGLTVQEISITCMEARR